VVRIGSGMHLWIFIGACLFYHDQRRYGFVLYYVGVAKALANRRNGLPSIGLRHNLDRSHKGLLMSGGATVLIPAVI